MRYVSKPAECEAMWWDPEDGDPDPNSAGGASDIVAWVVENGGEARYIAVSETTQRNHAVSSLISVHTINGWAHAKPGHYVVMGSATFECTDKPWSTGPHVLRDFYPCDPETFEKRWEPKG